MSDSTESSWVSVGRNEREELKIDSIQLIRPGYVHCPRAGTDSEGDRMPGACQSSDSLCLVRCRHFGLVPALAAIASTDLAAEETHRTRAVERNSETRHVSPWQMQPIDRGMRGGALFLAS